MYNKFFLKVVEYFELYGCYYVGNECFEVIFVMYVIYLYVFIYYRIFLMLYGIKMVFFFIIFIKYCLEIFELKILILIKRFVVRFS